MKYIYKTLDINMLDLSNLNAEGEKGWRVKAVMARVEQGFAPQPTVTQFALLEKEEPVLEPIQ